MKTKAQALEIIKNLTFGVEIECMFPKDRAIEHSILTNPTHWSHPIWMGHISTNGESLSQWGASWDQTITRKEGFAPIEFNSKVLKGEQGLKEIIKFFTWLADMGAEVDRSCGLHIHLGAKQLCEGLDLDQAIEQLCKTLKFGNSIKSAIFAQAGSAHRFLNGTWARTSVRNARQRIDSKEDIPCFGGKYFFINTRNIASNGISSNKATIEFRAFAGTTNYLKVLNHLMTAFVTVYAGMRYSRTSWESRNQTADKGLESYNALISTWSNHPMLTQFPTFQAEKRKMFKIGRKMAKKFVTNIRRAVTRSNGSLDLNRFA